MEFYRVIAALSSIAWLFLYGVMIDLISAYCKKKDISARSWKVHWLWVGSVLWMVALACGPYYLGMQATR